MSTLTHLHRVFGLGLAHAAVCCVLAFAAPGLSARIAHGDAAAGIVLGILALTALSGIRLQLALWMHGLAVIAARFDEAAAAALRRSAHKLAPSFAKAALGLAVTVAGTSAGTCAFAGEVSIPSPSWPASSDLPSPAWPTAPEPLPAPDLEPPAAAMPQQYTVAAGDSLWRIAEHLSTESRPVSTEALYSKNRTIIGPDPNFIVPGLILELP